MRGRFDRKLAIPVGAPGSDEAIGANCQAVIGAGGNGCHFPSTIQDRHVNRHRHVSGVPHPAVVAELAVVIVAPGGQGAVAAQRQAMFAPRRDGGHGLAVERRGIRRRVDRHRHGAHVS